VITACRLRADDKRSARSHTALYHHEEWQQKDGTLARRCAAAS
jgi:hypothetical protein